MSVDGGWYINESIVCLGTLCRQRHERRKQLVRGYNAAQCMYGGIWWATAAQGTIPKGIGSTTDLVDLLQCSYMYECLPRWFAGFHLQLQDISFYLGVIFKWGFSMDEASNLADMLHLYCTMYTLTHWKFWWMGPILLCIHPSQKYLELPEETVIVRGLPLRCLCSSLSFGMSAQVHLGQSVGGDDDDEAPKKQTKNGKSS